MIKHLIRPFSCILSLLLIASAASAESLPDTGKAYTAPIADMTVLQGQRPGEWSCVEYDHDTVTLIMPPVVTGESPTTGLPIPMDAAYQPMLVQISNAVDSAQSVNGRSTKAAGVGKRAPWGGQYADIVYESVLYRSGETRLTFFYYDSLALGLPTSVGPVRSSRVGSFLLSQEWGGGFVYAGSSQMEREYLSLSGIYGKSTHFNLHTDRYHDLKQRVQGLRAPDNYDVNVAGFYQELPQNMNATTGHFLFADDNPYQAGYEAATRILLDWGHEAYISSFVYDEASGLYSRFCGSEGDVPYMSYFSATDRTEENMTQLSFANVIVQRVENIYPSGSDSFPVLQGIGKGHADIFIGGRYIAGYWVKLDASSPTLFLDDKGEPLKLNRGKTYIAQLSPLRLLAFK